MSKPLKVFITYSHNDLQQNTELKTRLAVMEDAGEIEIWDDNKILPGDEWEKAISDNLAGSDILLYLTSAPSLASKNCNKELAEALSANIRVIPIILEACDWEKHQLSRFEVLPHKGKPISKWDHESDGWQNVVEGIRKAVDKMQSQMDSPSGVSENELLAELAFQHGNVLMMLGQVNMAIERYSHAISLNPNDVAAYNNRGNAYAQAGDYDRAIQDFDKAIQLNPNYVNVYISRGAAYNNKGDFDRAIADFNKAMQLNPDYAKAYSNRGAAYNNKGDFDRAIADFNKAIQLNPDYAGAYNNRGIAYNGKDDFDRAIADFNKAIQLNPDFAEAYNNRGAAYSQAGDYDRAIQDFDKAIQLKPDFVNPYINRGAAYVGTGDYDCAIADLNKAIALNPDSANAYYYRGVACTGTGDYDCAIADFDKAIALNTDYTDAYYYRGGAYGGTGDYDCAIADFDKAIALNPDSANAYYYRGITYGGTGDFDRAIEDYTKAIQLNPDFAEAYNNRGGAYHGTGDYDRAIADFDKAIALNPDSANAYNNRGAAYYNKGDFDRAIEDYTKAIQLNPDFAEAYNNRGGAYGGTGDYDRAIADSNKAINLNPDYTDAYYYRGAAYYNKGDFDRAIGDLNTAIQFNPDDATAYYNRGVAYTGKGDFDRAIEDYTKAIALNPDSADTYCNRGEAWLHLKEWEKARADLMTARNMGVDIIAAFHNDYKSVEAYERANRVKLPEDIALMLTQRRRSRFPRTQKLLREDGTPFESPDVLNLLAKLRNAGTPLSQYLQTRPAFGIKTGASGAFVVDSVTRDQLIAEHPASADILKPFLHGRDIRRWGVESPVDKSRFIGDSWLIFTHRRIEIDRYPAIRKHLEQYRSVLSKRAGKQKWYELPTTKRGTERFTQTKLICPNSYNHQTFAVDTEGFYCGDTCYLIPTAETWLCGLLNSHIVEWFYSQTSNQLTIDYLRARSRYIQQIPIPDLTPTQKSLIGKIVDYLIYLQGQPTTNSRDLAHARDFIILRYFERIIDGLAYESYLGEELHQGEKQFFKPLLDERLPQLEEIRGDKMAALQEIFERLYERTHPIRRNLFFLNSVKPIRIIEDRT